MIKWLLLAFLMGTYSLTMWLIVKTIQLEAKYKFWDKEDIWEP